MNKLAISVLLGLTVLAHLALPASAKDRGAPGTHPVAKGAAVGKAVSNGAHPAAKGAAVGAAVASPGYPVAKGAAVGAAAANGKHPAARGAAAAHAVNKRTP